MELGLAENQTGIICIGAQAALGGAKRWEERNLKPNKCIKLISIQAAR